MATPRLCEVGGAVGGSVGALHWASIYNRLTAEMLYLIFAATVLWLLYKKWTSVYSYWDSKGFPSVGGSFPFGTSIELSLTRKYFGHNIDMMYRQGRGHPYVGTYDVRIPYLILRDPEIIKLILAKEFSHFRDRSDLKIPDSDPLSHHLFFLEGERWRALRVKLSPTFTSGKLKAMFPLFLSCAEALDSVLLEKVESSIDVKDVSARFTTDVICSCAFGLEVDSTRNEDNEFRKIGASFFVANNLLMFAFFFVKIYNGLIRYMKFRFTPKHIEDFIMKVVRETVEYREKNDVRRNDFLDLLIQLKNKGALADDTTDPEDDRHGQTFELTLELLAAQCFVFFLAGFETSSSVQTFCLYELALNQDIQERLHNEIEETIAKHGELSHQAIQEMEYLDMVISETMRKYPTLPVLSRRCTKPLVLPEGHKVDKGDQVLIPVWSLHHDPEYFPNPDTFDPERFSPENKESIRPFAYLPFGEGPRNCIGMRFGLLQTKVGLITVLRKYRVTPTERTPKELSFTGGVLITLPKEPLILNISKRTS